MINCANLCQFEGRLIADAKMGQITWNGQNGQQSTTKAEFTIAVDRKMTKQQKQNAQNAGKPTADFIRCVAVGPKGDFVGNWLGKGKACKVVGSLETTSWTDGQGNKQYGWQINVEDIAFTISDSGAGNGNGGNNNNGANNSDNNNNNNGFGNNGNNNNYGGGNFNNSTFIDESEMPF